MPVSKGLHTRVCVGRLQRNPELMKANWPQVTQLLGSRVQANLGQSHWLCAASICIYFSLEKPGLVQRRALWAELERAGIHTGQLAEQGGLLRSQKLF